MTTATIRTILYENRKPARRVLTGFSWIVERVVFAGRDDGDVLLAAVVELDDLEDNVLLPRAVGNGHQLAALQLLAALRLGPVRLGLRLALHLGIVRQLLDGLLTKW